MSMSDPIADMLTRIRNAQAAKQGCVEMPSSKMKAAIVSVLYKEGYVDGLAVEDLPYNKKKLVVQLRYHNGVPAISSITRMSKPGLRIYRGAHKVPSIMNGLGICVLSTSRGILTDREARHLNIGGELLCSVS